jgi:hypothetical protein
MLFKSLPGCCKAQIVLYSDDMVEVFKACMEMAGQGFDPLHYMSGVWKGMFNEMRKWMQTSFG